jgi:hypothetical protein
MRDSAPRLAIHSPRCRAARTQKPACVLARKTNLAKLLCNRRPGLTLPPKPEFAPHDSSQLADPMPPQAIRRPFKSHRWITASVAPATYFKRPYRNCPRRSCARTSTSRRDSPDRNLAFFGTDRSLPRSVLGPRSRPRRQSQIPPLQKASDIPAFPRGILRDRWIHGHNRDGQHPENVGRCRSSQTES